MPMAEGSPDLAGVTLTQYALVHAGLADELPLGGLLKLAGIEARVWPAADRAWSEQQIADLDQGGDLAEQLVAAMDEARDRWVRRLPPLDEDLSAWLDFQHAWALEVDEQLFLGRFGMRAADVRRLQVLWAERMAHDPSLRQTALLALAEERGRPPTPRPEPATLPLEEA